MSVRILWGINRPDGSPVQQSPKFGSAFWVGIDGEFGYPSGHEDAAAVGAKELTDHLIRCGVHSMAAKHEVVRITITTSVRRELDWDIDTDGNAQ